MSVSRTFQIFQLTARGKVAIKSPCDADVDVTYECLTREEAETKLREIDDEVGSKMRRVMRKRAKSMRHRAYLKIRKEDVQHLDTIMGYAVVQSVGNGVGPENFKTMFPKDMNKWFKRNKGEGAFIWVRIPNWTFEEAIDCIKCDEVLVNYQKQITVYPIAQFTRMIGDAELGENDWQCLPSYIMTRVIDFKTCISMIPANDKPFKL